MKTIARHITVYSLALYLLPDFIPGLEIQGGLLTYLLGGIALTLIGLIIKPILHLISIPVNIITMGLFNLVINALLLYLLTIFITDITIHPFVYEKFNIWIFSADKIAFNTFFAYAYVAFMLSLIDAFANWLRR